jgi:DHA2 family multidrug resistance protein
MIMGLGMPFFFISVSGMALASVNADETASAAGLLNFSRTLLAAFAISVMTTNWESYSATVYADLVGSIDAGGDLFKALTLSGVESNKIYSMMDRLLSAQSVMIATNAIMAIVALAFLLGAIVIWFAPRPRAWSAETAGSDSGATAEKNK